MSISYLGDLTLRNKSYHLDRVEHCSIINLTVFVYVFLCLLRFVRFSFVFLSFFVFFLFFGLNRGARENYVFY